VKPYTDFTKIVDRKRYSVKAATLIAGNDYWDGHNFERRGSNTWLYKTPAGAFFTVTRTQWQGEQDDLSPVTEDRAIELYESTLSEHRVDYETAFPNVEIVNA